MSQCKLVQLSHKKPLKRHLAHSQYHSLHAAHTPLLAVCTSLLAVHTPLLAVRTHHKNTHTHTHTHTHTCTHTHTHTHTCIVFTTANFGYVAPNSKRVSQQEASGQGTPLAVGTPAPTPQPHGPHVQRGYSSVGLQDPRDEKDGVQP